MRHLDAGNALGDGKQRPGRPGVSRYEFATPSVVLLLYVKVLLRRREVSTVDSIS